MFDRNRHRERSDNSEQQNSSSYAHLPSVGACKHKLRKVQAGSVVFKCGSLPHLLEVWGGRVVSFVVLRSLVSPWGERYGIDPLTLIAGAEGMVESEDGVE